jgi:succinyl-diaminopimelate desuccinylase
MDKQFDKKVISFLDAHKDEIFADVDRMLRIDSVKREPAEGAPLGKPIHDAIDAMLDICAAHGLKTQNIGGVVGEAAWGEGEERLGIVSHVDIVPAGSGWTKPPLALTREGGMLWGRGVADDKGPGVAALWALLAALHAGAALNKKVVFIIGGDEETGDMRCLKKYIEAKGAPDMAFTPDADFPAIYCEKTIVRGELGSALPAGSALMDIAGGTRVNVVPGEAHAVLSVRPSGALPEGVAVEEAGGGWTLRARGTAAHASTPERGDNAAVKLLGALKTLLPEGDPALPVVCGLYGCFAATDGSGLGIACADAESGPLTLNLGVLRVGGGSVRAEYDIRHPALIDPKENIFSRIPEAAARAGLTVGEPDVDMGFCLPKDHPFIETLMRVYNDISGSGEPPVAIGGGTYARKLPCAAAYGMLFPGDPETAHMADERISEASFLKAARIYAHAIAELGK